MIQYNIPVVKYVKFRNKSSRISTIWDKQGYRLRDGFQMGLLALESGILDLNQMNVINKTMAKYIKPRVKMSKRDKFLRAQRQPVQPVLKNRAVQASRPRIRKIPKEFQMGKSSDEVKFILSFFPQVSITKKPIGTRMGKGKGAIEKWGMVIKKGRVLVQVRSNIKSEIAFNCLQQVKHRLPFRSKIICRSSVEELDVCKFYRIGRSKF